MLLLRLKAGKIKFALVSILICLICVFSSTAAFTQTTLPRQIRIGTRTAAFPIGWVGANGEVSGFCGVAFQEGLQEELSKRGIQSSVNNQAIVNQYRGQKYPRYNGLLKQTIEIECGTNSPLSGALYDTATNKRFGDEIAFSNPFYQSGLKLLLKVDQAKRLNNLPESERESEIYKLRIGVVQNTTTLKHFQDKGKGFTAYPTREEALDDLDNGNIEAFATDALIVQTLLERGVKGNALEKDRPPYKEREFTLFPLKSGNYLPGLDLENYVIAIKKNTPYANELLDIINATLSSIRDRNGLANVEKDYVIPDETSIPSQATAKPSISSTSGTDPSDLILIICLIILAIVAIIIGAIVIAVIATKRGDIFHQNGSGDNIARDKVGRNKINTRNSDSQDEDA
jgi:ABC-type amino acid transport substrate-binding protein